MAETKLKDHYKIETWKKVAFGVFFVILAGVLVYLIFFSGSSDSGNTSGNFVSSITGSFALTGGAISESDLESPIQINANFSTPESFVMDQRFSELEITFSEETTFYLGEQSFNFSENDSLILKNYTGEISSSNESSNFKIEGEALKADLKGIQMSAEGGFDVLSEDLAVSSIEARGVSLDEFKQITSGTIKVGSNEFNPENEEVVIESFIGDLNLDSKDFVFDGKAESLRINGETKISVSD